MPKLEQRMTDYYYLTQVSVRHQGKSYSYQVLELPPADLPSYVACQLNAQMSRDYRFEKLKSKSIFHGIQNPEGTPSFLVAIDNDDFAKWQRLVNSFPTYDPEKEELERSRVSRLVEEGLIRFDTISHNLSRKDNGKLTNRSKAMMIEWQQQVDGLGYKVTFPSAQEALTMKRAIQKQSSTMQELNPRHCDSTLSFANDQYQVWLKACSITFNNLGIIRRTELAFSPYDSGDPYYIHFSVVQTNSKSLDALNNSCADHGLPPLFSNIGTIIYVKNDDFELFCEKTGRSVYVDSNQQKENDKRTKELGDYGFQIQPPVTLDLARVTHTKLSKTLTDKGLHALELSLATLAYWQNQETENMSSQMSVLEKKRTDLYTENTAPNRKELKDIVAKIASTNEQIEVTQRKYDKFVRIIRSQELSEESKIAKLASYKRFGITGPLMTSKLIALNDTLVELNLRKGDLQKKLETEDANFKNAKGPYIRTAPQFKTGRRQKMQQAVSARFLSFPEPYKIIHEYLLTLEAPPYNLNRFQILHNLNPILRSFMGKAPLKIRKTDTGGNEMVYCRGELEVIICDMDPLMDDEKPIDRVLIKHKPANLDTLSKQDHIYLSMVPYMALIALARLLTNRTTHLVYTERKQSTDDLMDTSSDAESHKRKHQPSEQIEPPSKRRRINRDSDQRTHVRPGPYGESSEALLCGLRPELVESLMKYADNLTVGNSTIPGANDGLFLMNNTNCKRVIKKGDMIAFYKGQIVSSDDVKKNNLPVSHVITLESGRNSSVIIADPDDLASKANHSLHSKFEIASIYGRGGLKAGKVIQAAEKVELAPHSVIEIMVNYGPHAALAHHNIPKEAPSVPSRQMRTGFFKGAHARLPDDHGQNILSSRRFRF